MRALFTPPKPTVTKRQRVDDTFLEDALRSQVPNWQNGVSRMPLDSNYYTTTKTEYQNIVDKSPTNWLIWTPDSHDCDDFAWAARNTLVNVFGLTAVGFVNDYSATHAYNCVVDVNGTVWFFEPDSDMWGFKKANNMPIDDRHTLSRGRIII